MCKWRALSGYDPSDGALCCDSKTRLIVECSWSMGGQERFQFSIKVHSNSDYAKFPDTRRSIADRFLLNGSPVIFMSSIQKMVSLLTTKAKGIAGVMCTQDMLYIMKITKSLGLDVKKLMVFKMDNKGAVGLASNWSAGGHTRHIAVWSHFLWELKEKGIIKIDWISMDENDAIC